MKVIFLDVDGVLNCEGSKSRAPSGVIGVDADKVKGLRQIAGISGARIVLTSTWKDGWSKDRTSSSMDLRYLSGKLWNERLRISDVTKYTAERGKGIYEWLEGKNVESWVVLDDDVFHDYEEYGIMPHLVKTSFIGGGLQDEHIDKAIEMLYPERVK